MQHILKTVITLLISLLMQSGVVNMISTTPHDAVSDFMDGLKNRDSSVMEKYMDDSYVNFITNVQGDDAVVERMNEALFRNFSYKIEKIKTKDDVAVAKVSITSGDFSNVLSGYESASYEYITDNLQSDEIADKDYLNAKCLEIYVEQVEAAADSGTVLETVVYIPMIDDGYYGWNIIMTDDLMKTVLGNLQMPASCYLFPELVRIHALVFHRLEGIFYVLFVLLVGHPVPPVSGIQHLDLRLSIMHEPVGSRRKIIFTFERVFCRDLFKKLRETFAELIHHALRKSPEIH